MTCKDCLHYESHKHFFNSPNYKKDFDDYFRDKNIEHKCPEFTNRSEWVHLPCKVGDKLYKIAPDFEKQRGSLKIQEYTVTDIIGNALITRPYTVFKVDRIGADVFITREEAEKALEGMKEDG